jgi:hypothetical protein
MTYPGRYRRVVRPSIWPWRVITPLFALTVISVITRNGFSAIPVAAVVVVSVTFLLSMERSGVSITDGGLEARSPLFGRTFRYAWSDVTGFSVERIPGAPRTVVCVCLRNGRREILPTLQVWTFQRRVVEPLCEKLNAELARISSR